MASSPDPEAVDERSTLRGQGPPRPMSAQRAARLRRTLTALAVVLALAGAIVIVTALRDQHHAPAPSKLAQQAPLPSVAPTVRIAGTTAAPPRSSTSSPPRTTHHRSAPPSPRRGALAPLHIGRGMPASQPLRLSIPAIKVSTSVMTLGLNADSTVQTPPLSRHSVAGWYEFSATPGSLGASVVLGHIDSAEYGPGVFFRLGALNPGDEVDVQRRDGRTAVFRIDRVAEYPKTNFPTELVYGRTRYAALRLVTCGGSFDAATRNYRDNIIAFASLAAIGKQ